MDNSTITRNWPTATYTEIPSGRAAGWETRDARGPAEYWQFFKAFLRQPTTVGALVPSSRSLARAAIQGCDLENAETVIELGPGTGVITREILKRIGANTLFLALELDGDHVHRIRQRYPRVHVHNDSAENIRRALSKHGRKKADYIISALPWGMMGCKVQDRILRAVFSSLHRDGIFTTYAYLHTRLLPTGQHFRQRLEKHFDEVATSQVVWRNLPPAFVYRCG